MDGMDLLQGIREAEGDIPAPPGGEHFVPPSLEQMLAALENMDLGDEEKENLKNILTSRAHEADKTMEDLFSPAMEILPLHNPLMSYVLLVAIVLVLSMFVFFGYKLFKSLKDKERKRGEKRKQKKEKKKK